MVKVKFTNKVYNYCRHTVVAHLIYFLGSTKSTDEKRRFYNACADVKSNYEQVIQITELQKIGKLVALTNK